METHQDPAIERERLRLLFERIIPFNRFLGITVIEIGEGTATLEVPFRDELLGNPVSRSLHGGVISALLDNCGGMAVWSRIAPDATVATVDMRVDYLRPGRPEPLVGFGRVVRLGNRVGVVELRAFHPGDEERPIAAGMAVYNIRRGTGGSEMWERLLAAQS